MFKLSTKSKNAMYGAIIDIGSASVGVGIVESDHTKKLPKILFSHRVYMRISSQKNEQDERMRQMREALFSASLVLSKDGMGALKEYDRGGKIGRILITCSSPWSHTVAKSVAYEQEKPFKISKSILRDLVKTAEEEMAETLDETAIIGSLGLEVVERATVNVTVNGYHVQNPLGLSAKTIELSHITGLLPKEIIDAVYEVREKIFSDTDVSAHTYMLVMYCVLRDLFPTTHSLCIVDITGETTEIGIVKAGILVDTVHAPYGSNTLLRAISNAQKSTSGEALSLLQAYGEKTLADSEYGDISKIAEEYDVALVEALEKILMHRSIPQTLIITALPQVSSFFRERVLKKVTQLTHRSHTEIEIKKSILDAIASLNNNDTYITLAARFFHKLHGCGEIETK